MEGFVEVGESERRELLVGRLVAVRQAGRLPAGIVAEAARSLGVSPRTVWRWVAAGTSRRQRRPRRELDEQERAGVFAQRGNIAAAHERLAEEDPDRPSVRTLQRAVARDLTPAERAYARSGVEGARAHAVYLRHEASRRAETYEADHKQLAIEVLAPRAQRPQRPWVTIFLDQYSRLIVGWAISLQPTSAEVLAALRMAVVADPARGFGGIPGGLRYDGGLEFAAGAIQDAAAAMGCLAIATEPYSPWQKGKIERLNRTIEQTLLSGLPYWTGGRRGADGRLHGPSTGPMTLGRFVGLFETWVRAYNTERPHQALKGATPLERWRQDASPVPALAEVEARWMLLAARQRTVNKDGIHFAGHIYVSPQLNGLVGERLDVRYMPHDSRSIELYRDGEHLTTAYPQGALTGERRDAVLARRREDAKKMAADARRASRKERTRFAPMTEAGDPQSTDVVTGTPEDARRRDAAARSARVVRMLGLGSRLNRPQPDPSEPSDGDEGRAA